jgi:pyridoxal phosphate enzyme (YggS family)
MNPRNYQEILKHIAPFNARLIVVSKYRSFDEIEMVRSWGQSIFAENRVRELVSKKVEHPNDLSWHLIGTLQKNKVKELIPCVDLIHSVDSLSLLTEINKQAGKHQVVQDCLLQIKIAEEETKQGLSREGAHELLSAKDIENLTHIRVRGLMGMATNTDNQTKIRHEFKCLRKLFEELKQHYFLQSDTFDELSAGMSDDYQIALEEGSTCVRIGSMIFNS